MLIVKIDRFDRFDEKGTPCVVLSGILFSAIKGSSDEFPELGFEPVTIDDLQNQFMPNTTVGLFSYLEGKGPALMVNEVKCFRVWGEPFRLFLCVYDKHFDASEFMDRFYSVVEM